MLFASNNLQIQTKKKIFAIGLVSIALTACGGGGGSSSTSSGSGSASGSSGSGTGSTSGSGTGSTSGSGSTGSGTGSGSGSSPTPASFAYALTSNASGSTIIQQYSVATSGALSAVTSPTPIALSFDAQDVVLKFDPTRKYAYTESWSGSGNGNIVQYSLGANGVLTPMTPASIATDTVPSDISIDPTGKFVYVSNWGVEANGTTAAIPSTITEYKIGTGGALSLIGKVTLPTTLYAEGITSTATSVYVTLGNNANVDSTSISQYVIQADGTLASSPASTVNLTHFTKGLMIAANGKYAYAPNYVEGATSGSTIYEYSFSASGALVPNGSLTLPATANPFKIAIDANSKYAYVSGVQSNISQFIIGTDGKLSAMAVPTITTSSTPHSIIIDPTNKFVYVGDIDNVNVGGGVNNGITQYSIGSDGSLSQLSFLATAAGIQGVALN